MNIGPIVEYECPEAGNEHAVPSDEVRVMMAGDGGFVIACECGEPLEEADETPHPTTDHLVNVYGNDPTPSDWLRLEEAANGWYDADPWEPPEGHSGTRMQRRQRTRERAKEMSGADIDRPDDDPHNKAARKVECPNCGVGEGQKCKRPSGHRVRKSHGERKERAKAEGVIEPEDADEAIQFDTDQAELSGWSA